jgi:hypothetical protein
MTLTEFLLARIAEDEDEARIANAGYYLRYSFDRLDQRVVDHLSRHAPARVLAECEAKRRIVAEHPDYGGYGESCETCADSAEDLRPWPCETLLALAAVYADHPDYDEAWRP